MIHNRSIFVCSKPVKHARKSTMSVCDTLQTMDQSLEDLRDDFKEIHSLAQDIYEQLSQHRARISTHLKHYRPLPYTYVIDSIDALLEDVQKILHSIATREQALHEYALAHVTAKKELYDMVRIIYTRAGALMASDRWQAPSSAYSEMSQAGLETGSITSTLNDYKRGIQADEQSYAARFIKEYVDQGLRIPPTAHLTSSGMAAFLLALDYVRIHRTDISCVLVGKGTYFECMWTLNQWFGDRIGYFDEFDIESFENMLTEYSPDLVVVSSLANTVSMSIPDMPALFSACSRRMKKRSFVVLDNTGMASMYQPLKDIPVFQMKASLLVVESLLKYHQFGFDRVNAGILWLYDFTPPLLRILHRNIGLMPSDTNILSLPRPQRKLFDARMRRIGRNNATVAQRLYEHVHNNKKRSPVESIVHPSLPSYPGSQWASQLPFHGGSFVITFSSQYKTDRFYFAFIKKVLREARKQRVDINDGTSFGFTTSRVYFTARFADSETEPFVRVSIGTETIRELDGLVRVLCAVIDAL